jgi:hypothetical protein
VNLVGEWAGLNSTASSSEGGTLAAFLLIGSCFGALFGFAQWLVVRRYVRLSWVWLLAPFVGLGALLIGFLTGLFFYPVLRLT